MDRKEKLVLSIIEFLEQSIADGTVREDDKEGIEVAMQCIGEAFGVDPSNEAQRTRLSVKPATLPSIFDVYLKTKERVQSSQPAASTSQAAPAPAPAPPKPPSAQDKAAAEAHKLTGNQKMSAKDYVGAIKAYDSAILLDPTNPVFYSNRAAANSSSGDHIQAVVDAKKAIEVDPTFVKAYHRLGHAHYCLAEYQEAADAFQRGIDLDPQNANLRAGKENALARVASNAGPTPTQPSAPAAGAGAGAGGAGGMPDFSEVLRSLGGGGGATPGGFDIASMLQNPALMSMAQNMMASGGLDNLMRNPAVANMMDRVQSGGGLPSMAELMNDPSIRQMAQNFQNAQNSGAGGAGGAGQ